MAYRTAQKIYTNQCDAPDCLKLNSVARVFFKAGATTTDGKPYLDGVITSITQNGDGGVTASFRYSEVTAPPGFVMAFPTAITGGNVCDPDCFDQCSWLWKVQKLIDGIDQSALINRSYQIFPQSAHLANLTTYIPRIPFATGFHLTSVKLCCHFYDSGTTATFTLRYRTPANAGVSVGSLPICATFTGNLAAQRAMTVSVPVIPYDSELILVISSVATTVYANSTQGLTLDTLGFIVP